MVKRGINEKEIALIKAMRMRGMKNKDIQFLFNRPDRAVNSGRISNIAAGTYGNSKDITAASDEDVDAFLEQGTSIGPFAAVKVPVIGKIPIPAHGPVDAETLSSMFHQDLNGIWRFKAGETDQHECKANFGFKHSGVWLRAIAALANNRGGYIFFGVHDKDDQPLDGLDKSYAVVGFQDTMFQDADPVEFAKKIKSSLDPTPRIHMATIKIDGKDIGVIHVEQHSSRPVIASGSVGEKLKEGEIYFRYPGQSDRIKYSDLRTILDARDAQARQDVLPMVERLLALGPNRALIADLARGTLGDGKQQIVIDSELVNQIKFIREGDFTQMDGSPTLKLVGEVRQLTDQKTTSERLIRDSVLEEDILRNFLHQNQVERPEAYIRQCIDLQKKWLPIFYYVKQSGKSASDLASIMAKEKTTHLNKQKDLVARLRGTKTAKGKPSSNAVRSLQSKISKAEVTEPTDLKQVSTFANAIVSLNQTSAELPLLLSALRKAKEIAETDIENKLAGTICRAACRLDEIFFGPKS